MKLKIKPVSHISGNLLDFIGIDADVSMITMQ